jgi:hypothetical protein
MSATWVWQRGEAGLDAVVVREDESVGGDERARAVGQANGRIAYAIEPRLVEPGLQRRIRFLEREAVEGPHAFVGLRGGTQQYGQRGARRVNPSGH